MAYNNSERPASRRPARRRRKVCVFCGGEEISYKDAAKPVSYTQDVYKRQGVNVYKIKQLPTEAQ